MYNNEIEDKDLSIWDLELFLTPDSDFDKRVEEFKEVKPQVSWIIDSKLSFPEINLLDDDWDSEIQESQEIEEEKIILSELEIQKQHYSISFQKILQIDINSSLEDFIRRYAKILLYILEQFHIFENDKKHHNWDKRYFLKFMIDLKKILGEINNEEQEKNYRDNILKRPYVKISWELKEEIELLFNIYYSSYIDCQKQIHEKVRLEEIEKRRKLEESISQIYEELNSQLNLDNPNETPAQKEIRLKKEELAKKRIKRDSQLSQ